MSLFSRGKDIAPLNVSLRTAPKCARHHFRFVAIIAALAACLMLPLHAANAQGQAPTFSVLHSFSGNSDGAIPYAGLAQGRDGSFYGTAFDGGANGDGTIFKITPTGAFTTLYSFPEKPAGKNTNGGEPYGGLVQGSDGNFYGTTFAGGSAGQGTVFKITPAGAFTLLTTFTGTNGSQPSTALVQGSDGNFYGTTFTGGLGWDPMISGSGTGTLFKMTPSGTLTTLHLFGGGSSDGANPRGALLEGSDGNFYGTTFSGGPNNDGTIFKITPSGTLTPFSTYGSATGESLRGGLIQGTDGNFYGLTEASVFKITPSGILTTLAVFSLTDGFTTGSLLQGRDGNFYGTTAGTSAADSGSVFQVTPSGAVTTLYSFSPVFGPSGGTNADGADPLSGVIQGNDGNLYGTASAGGPGDGYDGLGTIFKITLPSTASPTAITSISPATLQAGNLPFTLTVTGTGFSHGVTADFNGTVLTPTFAASTKLTFNVPAALVAIPGTLNVAVSTPDVAPSNGLPFAITPGLTLTGVSPSSVPAGSQPISVTVTGTNFVNGCVVKWNGQPLPTYYLNESEATATVSASYLTTAGTAKITISNPHVYATPSLTFTVAAH